MSQYQAGTLVVYGNLGVHEIEAVGPQSFCGEPAREYYTLRPYFSDSHDRSYIPTAKEGVLRPVSTQRSKGRKVNTMDAYFYQMAERTLREELAVAFHETPEAAARRLEAAVS